MFCLTEFTDVCNFADDTTFLACDSDLTLLSLGGWGWGGDGLIFASGKFKIKLFLNGLWYEPETLWLFLTFTRDYFARKKIQQNIKLSGVNIFLFRGKLNITN